MFTISSSVSGTLTWRSLLEGVIVSKHNVKCDRTTTLGCYLYQPHLSSTNLLWRNITILEHCCAVLSNSVLFRISCFRFLAVLHVSISQSVTSLYNILLILTSLVLFFFLNIFCQGVIFLSWPFARCSTKSCVFDPSQVRQCVRVCVRACVSYLSTYSIFLLYNLLVEYLPSKLAYLSPHILRYRKYFTQLLK
jgi:hypothetical protein